MIGFGRYRTLLKTFSNPFLFARQFSNMTSEEDPQINFNQHQLSGWPLKHILDKLDYFAPLSRAEDWDNVGLLIEPYQTKEAIKKIFLTNDLTVNVMEEAMDKNVDLIISYHPPIFAPLKRITQNNWKSKIVSMCLAKGIYLYSPHTAWDCAPYGESLNHWISRAFAAHEKPEPIIMRDPETLTGSGLKWRYQAFSKYTIRRVIDDIQNYIGLPVHVALGVGHSLDTIILGMACCAGSGASLLKQVSNINMYVTGEMSHHELLDAQHRNITVILLFHSNSERGFLKGFQKKLYNMLMMRCEVMVSECDKDPLETFIPNCKNEK